MEKRKAASRLLQSCGGRIRTCDLQVMSLASYQLLHSAMFKRMQRYTFVSIPPNFSVFFFEKHAKCSNFRTKSTFYTELFGHNK